MLRVILVVAPQPGQIARVTAALERTPLTSLYVAPECGDAAGPIARPHTLAATQDARFASSGEAIAAVSDLAETLEGTIAVVASTDVVRAVLLEALDAPVPAERLALDEGALAEVEVRTDAPWTVNRINDACHLGW